MSSLPQGTITFLFSDIEGSTQLAKRFGDAQWADLLEAHRTVLRRAFVGHAGSEVDAQGDAFFVVFSRATDAVAAALAAQQALLAHDWPAGGAVRVRMGLHTGEATFRDGCYIGQEVHRASRICGVGHGGQILLSQATSEIVRSYLPQSITLNELGEHRLKGLRELHRLFQLLAPGLTTTFPPLRSLRAPNNLPVERSSFVGREQEIIAVLGALAEHRLVTLTGIGGSGKTRLALQVGALEIGNFPDGVFFVDLAPVSDPDLVPQTLAAACGMAPGDSPSGTARTFVERVAVAMAPRRSLLLVDNCEHVLDAAAILIDRLLTVCEQIVVLATSRESLGVEGEQIVQLPSLTVPGESANAEVTEAMRLFAERAHACSASFKLGADTMGPVAEICRRLDGIPLAIEFAAARVSHLSVQQIAERLENRFSLLTGGRRRVHRQQTLAASLDWSHDLLDEEERMVFRRAGVFAGGFELNAAEAVCSGDGIFSGAVLDLLGSLAVKSLVTVGQGARGETRYRLLEIVRLYALDKLEAAGETHTFRSQHRDHFLAWLEAMPLDKLVFGVESIKAVGREIDNLRTATDWCLADDRTELVARLVTAMMGYWITGNSYRIPKALLEGALDREDRLSVQERVASHSILGWLSIMALDLPTALNHGTCAVDLAAGALGPLPVLAQTLCAFGHAVLASTQSSDSVAINEARRAAEDAVSNARKGVSKAWLANAELFSAYVELHVNNVEASAHWFTACVQTCRGVEFEGWLLPAAMSGLAASLHLLGRVDEGLAAAQGLLALQDLVGTRLPWFDGLAIEVAPALFAGGHTPRADLELYKAATSMRRNGVDLAPNHFLGMAAIVEFLRGRPERAGRLMGAARSLGGADRELMAFRTPISLAYYLRYQPLVRTALGPEAARRARDEGRAMTIDEAFSYALQGLGASAPPDV